MTRRGKSAAESARSPGEFELIARLFAPLAAGAPGAFGLLDDAACLDVPPGQALVATTDAVVAGVHFLPDDPPALVARKALRVNLSDLAAKGAAPAFYLLTTVLPKPLDLPWLEAFASGLAEDQDRFGVSLVGGDTTATDGPLTLSITALGFVPSGQMIRRGGAQVGDGIFVTGTIGDAALGLDVCRGELAELSPRHREALRARYRLPEPRVALGPALRGLASAALDVSDGLIADLGHILEVSGVGATIELGKIPHSEAARAALEAGVASPEQLASGGDDYEILFTAPKAKARSVRRAGEAAGVAITEIGVIREGAGLVAQGPDGRPVSLARRGFQHF